MQLRGLYIQDPLPAIGGLATGYLCDEGKRVAFIEQAQLTLRPADSGRIHEDAALDQVTVYIGYHAPDITLGIGTAIVLVLFLTGVDIGLDRIIVLKKETVVDRIDLPILGAFDIRMAQCEFSDGRVQSKPVDPTPGRIHHHGRRTIDDITCSYLLVTWLQKVGLGAGLAALADTPVDPEDRSDGDIHIDIAAAVQWIEKTNILGVIADIIIEDDEIIQLFTADAGTADAMTQHPHQLVVGEYIQLLDIFSLYIDGTGIAQYIDQAGLVDFYIDPLGGEADVPQKITELARGVGKAAELLKSEFVESEYFSVDVHTARVYPQK